MLLKGKTYHERFKLCYVSQVKFKNIRLTNQTNQALAITEVSESSPLDI